MNISEEIIETESIRLVNEIDKILKGHHIEIKRIVIEYFMKEYLK